MTNESNKYYFKGFSCGKKDANFSINNAINITINQDTKYKISFLTGYLNSHGYSIKEIKNISFLIGNI